MLHGFETWGVKKVWEIIHNKQERFCNKIKKNLKRHRKRDSRIGKWERRSRGKMQCSIST
jgi:hypothetical protein